MIGKRTRRSLSSFETDTMRFLGAVLLTCLTAACSSGGGESDSSSNTTPPPLVNNPPTITGSPATLVTQDQEYTFTPVASDPDGDSLTFSISNQPSWASFDAGTGNLVGTPAAIHVGTTLGVTISVSDGDASASLAPFDLEVRQIQLGSATVSWEVPSTNADGSPLTDLAGYRVHYGTASQSYSSVIDVNDADTTAVTIDNLAPGTWFFAVTALDLTDNESAFSFEVSKVVNQ